MNKNYLKLTTPLAFVLLFSGCQVLTTFTAEELEASANSYQRRALSIYKSEIYQNNLRERIYALNFKKDDPETIDYNSVDYNSLRTEEDPIIASITEKSAVKYKRSSLYTLMIADPSNDYYYPIKYVFGNSKLTEKFNDHNIGPYQIPGKMGDQNQGQHIENYLNSNQVAKQLIAKWFNRGIDGSFNMNLVGQRGQYSASDLDVKIALQTERGKAILKDAGEGLIDHTFVVVYDFENIDNWMPYLRTTVKSNITIKAYLYRLVWDDATTTVFYNDYWMDKSSLDRSRKTAFENSDIFKLKYVGSVLLEKKDNITIFEEARNEKGKTKKEVKDRDEINTYFNQNAIAIRNVLNDCFTQLQIKYPELRTKFPLYSGDPIAAKVGKKEGLKQGDEFEVLEQILHEDGTSEYLRMGIIKIGKEEDVWDNTTHGDWFQESALEYTIFQGQKGKYYSGMLIRKIN